MHLLYPGDFWAEIATLKLTPYSTTIVITISVTFT